MEGEGRRSGQNTYLHGTLDTASRRRRRPYIPGNARAAQGARLESAAMSSDPTAAAANLEVVRRYLAGLESGASEDEVAAFFAADAVQEEFPNRLVPNGARRDVAALREARARGRQVIRGERYEIKNAVAAGDRVALEVIWSGELLIPLGSLQAGDRMRAHFAVFIELRAGKIVAQRNYDCFDPW
jgi:ketosteroid isomerase-like protein